MNTYISNYCHAAARALAVGSMSSTGDDAINISWRQISAGISCSPYIWLNTYVCDILESLLDIGHLHKINYRGEFRLTTQSSLRKQILCTFSLEHITWSDHNK